MHLADGFLNTATVATTGAVAVGMGALAVRRVRHEMGDRLPPLMGMMSACIFSAQMVNFPIIGGASGHLMGSALAAIVLGPWAAMIVMTAVLLVQCLLFYDGGVTALGANIVNMAIVAPWVAYEAYRFVSRAIPGDRGRVAGAVIAGWLSMLAASATCAMQLAASGIYPIQFALPAMLGIHSVIGLAEAAITGVVVAFFARTRPDLLIDNVTPAADHAPRRAVALGMAMALAIAFFLSPLASAQPDGLESVVSRPGVAHVEEAAIIDVPFDDYELPALSGLWIATSIAGVIGAVVVCGLAWGLGRGLSSKQA